MMKKPLMGFVVLGVVSSGGLIADLSSAPAASAVSCVNRVTTWRAYNECAGVPARHWDAIKNAPSKYGNWASARQWSKQAACWANVVSFGYSLKS